MISEGIHFAAEYIEVSYVLLKHGEEKMKAIKLPFFSIIILLFIGCSASQPLKLGNCPLTVTVQSDEAGFDGSANVYIDGHFIGTTDNQSRQLRVNLKQGEYDIWVIAEGFEPWKSTILLLGEGYKQSALANLKRPTEQE